MTVTQLVQEARRLSSRERRRIVAALEGTLRPETDSPPHTEDPTAPTGKTKDSSGAETGVASAAESRNVESRLAALAAEGKLTRAVLPKKGWSWCPRGAGLPEGTAKKLLDELRADR